MRRLAAVSAMCLIAVAVYASQGAGVPIPWGTLTASGSAALVTWLFTRRKQSAEVANLDADTINKNAGTIGELFEQVQKLQQQVRMAEAHADELETEVQTLREEVARLTAALRPGRKTDPDVTPRLPIRR